MMDPTNIVYTVIKSICISKDVECLNEQCSAGVRQLGRRRVGALANRRWGADMSAL